MVYSVEPEDGWAVGDRAYCISGLRGTSPTVEKGKVYVVTKVTKRRGVLGAGLSLSGVTVPPPYEGIRSGRFVKLKVGARPAREIARLTAPGWADAYRMSTGQMARPA